MKNVTCNNSSLVCFNHFRKCDDYNICGKRWILNPKAVPNQFNREFEKTSEISDNSMNNEDMLKCIESEKNEKVDSQNTELERLEAEKNFWKEECMVLKAELVKTQEENNRLNIISSNELAQLKVITESPQNSSVCLCAHMPV